MDCVDIIMPVYNCEKYIGEAIETVKKQTYTNWKIIIINDNSTDNTKKEIEKKLEEKIIFIDLKEHVGVAEARNIGLKNSKSRYIAFLDADDMWVENKLEEQLNFMKKNEYGFTYTSFSYLKRNKQKKVKKIPESLTYNQPLKNTIILTSTVMIDKQKIEEFCMPQIHSEDTATWWTILKKGKKAYGLNEVLSIYRITKQGLSSNKIKNIRKTWDLYRKFEKLSYTKTLYYFSNYIVHAIEKRII